MRSSVASIRLQASGRVVSVFQVISKVIRTTRQAKPFLHLMLADSSGQLPALVWDNVDAVSAQFDVGNVLEIVGELVTYRGELQIRLERIRRRELATLLPEELPFLDKDLLASEKVLH